MTQLIGVTTCKGRWSHLLHTLDSKRAELDALVVVDWGCPDRCAIRLEARGLPDCYVVRVPEPTATLWNPGAARNRGALMVRQTWPVARLVFVDADTTLREGFGTWARSVPAGCLGVAGRTPEGWDVRDLAGLLVVDSDAFEPYDERREYGHEDTELRRRLWVRGLDFKRCPLELLEFITHGNRDRMKFFPQELSTPEERRAERALLRQRAGIYPGAYIAPPRGTLAICPPRSIP